MQSIECATFHLNTNDINSSNTVGDYANGINNSYGSINSIRTDYSFYNIDFKQILGTMYEKYDRFNIKLSCAMSNSLDGYGTTNVDRLLKINISGLPLCNSGYHQLMGNTGYTTIGCFQLTKLSSNVTYFNDDNVFSFYKPMPLNNIRIYLQTISDVAPTTPANTIYPSIDYYFRIYGIIDK